MAGHHHVYDGQNRIIMTIDPLGNTNRTYYDELGNVCATVDPRGVTNRMLHDTRGRLVSSLRAWGPPTSHRNYGHDAEGRRTTWIHPDGVRPDMSMIRSTDRAHDRSRRHIEQHGL